MSVLSKPPLRNVPIGLSDTECSCMDKSNNLSRLSAVSAKYSTLSSFQYLLILKSFTEK